MKSFSELELLRFVHSFICIYRFVTEICEHFGNIVEKISVFGNSAKFRVDRHSKSIGFVFGLIQEIKVKFDISEFSVCQTSLE